MRELGNDLPLMGNSHEITAHHFILDLDVDMDQKVINGIITLFLKPSYRQIHGTDFVVKKVSNAHKCEKESYEGCCPQDVNQEASGQEVYKEVSGQETCCQESCHQKDSDKKGRQENGARQEGDKAQEEDCSNCEKNKDPAGSSGFKLEFELEGNTPVSNGNSFFDSSSKPEKETSRSEKVSGTEPDARTEFEGVGTSSVDQVGTSVETLNNVSLGSCNLDSFDTAAVESSKVKDCCTQSDSKTHGDFQLILDCCDIEILHVEEVLFTQDEIKRKAGRIESNAILKSSSKKYSEATQSNVLEREDGYNSCNGRQDTFDIFSKLMTDSKQNLAQERKANLSHNDESLQNPERHIDHTYCNNYNSAQSCVENCRTTTFTATPGKNTATTAEFHNDHDYLESKKSVLQQTLRLEFGSNGEDVARDEQSEKNFDICEEDFKRECYIPELNPTASKEEAKEVFATFMGIHNCSSGRPLHHRVDPWCVRIWREGVRDRETFPRVVRIKYRTTPEGRSLTWVTDQDGKPCMFTQGSCINNRSLFPCHDFLTMATWQAVVHAPHGATVLMSGEEPGVPWQREAVAWQPDAVTKQPDAVNNNKLAQKQLQK
ncbi:uncharacterized protein LOC118403512 [Branchiostoma floridae]|uniref:Uncharacterized protein LOC118403512 n=1 Tax=Branchiostoma floridae TaxID=7739 RepID=A0A9J7HEE4_BRAFL|nr:uncharacterized protein LOC118403512 [Branchiostoma floridae]